MMNRFWLYGPFDRFNFGDILFPIVLKKNIEQILDNKNIKYDIKVCSVIDSDLTKDGGFKTKSLQKARIIKEKNVANHLIVCGGEVITASWTSTLRLLSSDKKRLLYSIMKLAYGKSRFNNYAKNSLLGKSKLPWLIEKKDFKFDTISYNAVGGTSLKTVNDYEKNCILKILSNCNYLSVRDPNTKKSIEPVKAKIAPDCAVLISEIYDKNNIKKTIIKSYKNLEKDYFVFQINNGRAIKNEKTIADELEKVYNFTNLKIVILPTLRRYDYKAEIRIAKHLKCPFIILKEPNIIEIITIISRSKLFVGTSLHGNLTAATYKVKRFGIGEPNGKLISCLKYYGEDDKSFSYSIKDFGENVIKMLSYNEKSKKMDVEKIKAKAKININNMIKTVVK